MACWVFVDPRVTLNCPSQGLVAVGPPPAAQQVGHHHHHDEHQQRHAHRDGHAVVGPVGRTGLSWNTNTPFLELFLI